jgi:1-acyl-sn-glycerol-3-phosphate acyltransferase
MSTAVKPFQFYSAHKENFGQYSTDILPPTVHNASVLDTYNGRSVFLTGATGFVGKVILEKILRSVPDVKRVFLLVRPRKGQHPQDRLRAEVLTSQIFNPLRELRPDFDQFCDEKLVAVAGELTAEKVGLSDEDYQRLADEVNIIIHCAAVVDFNERLDRAIELNTLGSLRMLDLGKKCNDLGAFVHVSTCYVNSNRENGHIEERLYPLGFDPEEMIDRVSKMSSSELDTIVSTGILGNWPNTYTMTKAMTEHLLVKYRGEVPLVVVRPSIVGSSYSEPLPGWVDVISAAGAVYVAMGMGVIKFLEGANTNVGDVIPVDYVSNAIIVASAIIFKKRKEYFICQAASSSENPMCWGYPLNQVRDYFQRNRPPRGIAKPEFTFYSPQMFQIRFFLEFSIPSAILNTLALSGNSGYKQKSQLFTKLLWQVRVLTEAFKYFVSNQWCFDNRNIRSCSSMLRPEERQIFALDLASLDWYRYSELFSFGLCKYTLKMPIIPALARDARYINIVDDFWSPDRNTLQHRLFPDFTRIRSLYDSKYLGPKPLYGAAMPLVDVKNAIFNSPEVRAAIQKEVEKLSKMKQKKVNPQSGLKVLTPLEQVELRAKQIMSEMLDDQDHKVISTLGYFFTKLWRKVYENVKVAQENLPAIQHAASQSGKPIVYIPTHRSYVDFLLLSYVCFMVNLPLPHIVAGEDFLGIIAVRWLFRKSGAFFMKRSFSNDPLYGAILQKNLDILLQNNQAVEFFIEGTRSRSGKMLQPKMGLLGKITSALNRGVVQDVTIVPISINYEKTMESFMYANELNGESKVKESLTSLVKARSVFTNNFGTTTVVFGKPFSFNEWRTNFTSTMNSQNVPDFYNSSFNPILSTSLTHSPVLSQAPTVPTPIATNNTVIDSLLLHIQNNYENFKAGVAQSHQQRHGPCQLPQPPQNTTATGHWLGYALQNAPREFNPNTNQGHKLYMTKTLGHYITHTLNTTNEVFGTHIISTILLQYRTGITYQQLVDRTQWVISQIMLRGGYISHLEMSSIENFIQNAIKKLGPDLVQTTKRNNIYEPRLYDGGNNVNYTNLLVLGQYKNKIIHFFYYEALWCVVIYSMVQQRDKQLQLEQQAQLHTQAQQRIHGSEANDNSNPTAISIPANNGVNLEVALSKVKFLHSLLQTEFITTGVPDISVDFMAVLNKMVERSILEVSAQNNSTPQSVSVNHTNGEIPFAFLCSLLWPSIDSLYSASMLLLSLFSHSPSTISTSTSPSSTAVSNPTTQRQVITKDMLVLQSQWYANSLYRDSMLCFYESCSKDTLDNIVTVFKDLGLLQPSNFDPENTPNIATLTQEQIQTLMSNNNNDRFVLAPFYDQNETILESFVEAINTLRKQPPVLSKHNTMINPQRGGTRKQLVFDLPFLAKGPKTKL